MFGFYHSMKLKSIIPTMLLASAALYPQKLAQKTNLSASRNTFDVVKPVSVKKQLEMVTGFMEVIRDTNFAGGITHRYKCSDIDILRRILKRNTTLADYTAPVKNSENVYLEPFGMFFAKRPTGRPHLGLDIFTTPLARKPKTPVPVMAPIEGIIVSNKKANHNDNIVSNCVGMLGVDGKTYLFDHLARENDYETSIKMPKIGEFVKKGDTLGYVGCTGDTELWHLHFVVQTEESLELQKKNKMWNDYAKKSEFVTLKGQSDPLNEQESGYIARCLNEYRKQKLKTAKTKLLPYKGRETYLTAK